MLECHADNEFCVRVLKFDAISGHDVYQSLHFGVKCEYLKRKMTDGFNMNIDLSRNKICFKRHIQRAENDYRDNDATDVISENEADDGTDENNITDNDEKCILDILPNIITAMDSIGRKGDFSSVLKSISNGMLDINNIALNLLLDIRHFFRQDTIFGMKYNKT